MQAWQSMMSLHCTIQLGVLTSVRYGQEIMTADDTKGTDQSRTSGWVTIVSNNPKLTHINCYGNEFTELDISQNPLLNISEVYASSSVTIITKK
jgi:hypothetical protein